MTKTKLYRNRNVTGRAYLKTVGSGFEAGFILNGSPVFVGNFIHAKEANLWFNLMNRELRQFSRRYTVGQRFPLSWYTHFVRNHLYKTYYSFLDRLFTRYTKDFGRAYQRDLRRYKQIRKQWNAGERVPFLKVA